FFLGFLNGKERVRVGRLFFTNSLNLLTYPTFSNARSVFPDRFIYVLKKIKINTMKKIVKILPIICLTLFLFSCNNDDDASLDCACIEIFQPVCGDDGNQYSNFCFAECEGVNFTEGACEITTEAVVRDLGNPALDGCGWVLEFAVDGEFKNHRADELAEEYQVADLEIQLTYKPTLASSVCGLIEMVPVVEVIQIAQ
ncbi:MAG: hypothetical protein ACI9LN_001763, partial [Saprospiraceae bacterium]